MNLTDSQAIVWHCIQQNWSSEYFTNAELEEKTGYSLVTIQRITRFWESEGLIERIDNHPYYLFRVWARELHPEAIAFKQQLERLVSIKKARGELAA